MDIKHCHQCKRDLPVSDFYKNKSRADGLATACKECHKKENKKYRDRHPARVCLTAEKHIYILKVKTFANYCKGKYVQCAKCGFKDTRALSIDHVNGDGNKHRKELGIGCGAQFYRWLRDNNYPEGFQVLCMNCQWIKRHENQEHNDHTKTKSPTAR